MNHQVKSSERPPADRLRDLAAFVEAKGIQPSDVVSIGISYGSADCHVDHAAMNQIWAGYEATINDIGHASLIDSGILVVAVFDRRLPAGTVVLPIGEPVDVPQAQAVAQ